ncbi:MULTISPECIES: carbohydrate kinase family protein [Parabacteroides]|jgi:fructokinase|uniref:carbohydrate kinase family protein n=1 Tax=Parabacteroides TaxID=375288 RepID=UPI000EFDC4D0|nr:MULTISPECIES: carbohydrate kinase [Parabacteroides]RHU27131.1 carbohydrate kinase [Parabacteroides sp. TM07-1AC]WFE84570.1 carbohydrate kinase [Parabacteroides chongii]
MEQMKQQSKRPVVVGIGELLWDLLPTGKTAGGAPINFVYHASRLGAEGYAVSAIGDDEDGVDILKELDKNSIQYLIEKVPYPTGTVKVDLKEDGIPEYTITERVAWDHMSPTSDAVDLAERADAICFGALAQRSIQSRETIQAILSFAPDTAYRLFDINLRQHYYNKGLIEESLYLSNVLKMNSDEMNQLKELFGLSGTEDEIAIWFMEKYNLRMVVLTAGASYSTVYTPDEVSTLPIPEVEVVDTVGAGDAFSAALIMSLLNGGTLKEAHRHAVKIAAFVCSNKGAWPVYE